ncbi:transcription elongation factor [Violaceomyces palustris]|uniref:Transcription elongation factor n=1 Tax=Violaceomyces palustris TaxID=1673888 RepID=A0ACD0NT37_9BASI|nr:transcription elongation factor [Violaceomyces palustris]
MVELTVDQLKDLSRQLSKSQDAASTLVILDKLKQGLQPTEDIIRQSKVGVAVGKLRSNPDKKVSELAKELVRTWKAQVDKQRKQQQQQQQNGSTSNNSSKSPSAAPSPSTPAPTGGAGGLASNNNTPKKPAAEREGATTTTTKTAESSGDSEADAKIDFEILNDKTRNACLKLFYSSLEVGKEANGWAASTIFKSALAIEKATLQVQGKGSVNADYRNKVRSLSLNLKDKNNPGLRAKVVNGQVTAEELVNMSSDELASDARRAEREELQMQNLFKAKGAAAQEAETDAFQCGRCKQRKTRYYQMQTRSADEPMTTFVTCVACGNKWKFS